MRPYFEIKPRRGATAKARKEAGTRGSVTHFGGGGEATRLRVESPTTTFCLGLPVGQPGSVFPLTN